MQHQVQVPVLAESISEARLLGWHKKPGDAVQRGENLVDIETDKVTLEVPAPLGGKIHSLLKEPGQLVASGETIALIEEEGSERPAPVLGASESAPAAAPPTTDVATPPAFPSPPSSPTAVTPPVSQASPASPATPTAVPPPVVLDIKKALPTNAASPSPAPTGPAARRLLKEHGLKTQNVTPSGPHGRLLKEDVLRHLSERMESSPTPAPGQASNSQPAMAGDSGAGPTTSSAAADTPTAPAALATTAKVPVPTSPTPTSAADGAERPSKRTPMSGLRRNIAKRLLQAQHESALLSTFNEVNMLPVMQLRRRYRESFEKRHGTKLGLMSFFTRATIEALQRFPILNASIDGDDVLYHEYYDIGIAVSAPRGLVVPVLRNADRMSLADIELQVRELSDKARKGGLSVEELLGGTFTITNGGIFGSLLSTPIINPPQSAILGMHKIQERPIAEDGEVVVRPMMYLALSYDHRLIDGRDAVQFLVCIKEQMEDPARMLIQV